MRRGRRIIESSPMSRHACSRRGVDSSRPLRAKLIATREATLVEIARAQRKAEALAGLERWRARHAEAAAHLHPSDVLVDAMRGRFQTWTRIRVNLEHVPEELRPAQEPLDPDDAPKGWGPSDRADGVTGRRATRRTPSRARKES